MSIHHIHKHTYASLSPTHARTHIVYVCQSVSVSLYRTHTHSHIVTQQIHYYSNESVEKRTNPNTVGLQQQTKQQQKTRISQGFRDAWLQGQPDNEVPCLHTSDPVMLHQLNWHKLIKTYSGYHSEPFKEGENTLYNRLG